MKKFSKFLGIALIVALVLSFGASAFAASITITRDESYDGSSGRTYTAYKVFDAVYTELTGTNSQEDKDPAYTPEDAAVAYTMATDSAWVSVLWDTTKDVAVDGQTWFNVALSADGSVYVVTLVDGVADSDAADIAAFLEANLPENVTGTTITPGTAATVANGYYLIVASDGATNLTLVTTDVTIVEKNTYIVTTKETEETSYSVGDTIEYTATVEVPADASLTDPIILHDEMDEVLAFDADSVAATVDGDEFTGFSVLTGTDMSDTTCTFEISIPVTSAILGKTITFTYEAELTSAAVDPDTGFINELFGEKNGYTTTPDTPQVYDFDFDFVKEFTGSSSDLTAVFQVRTDTDDADTAITWTSAGEDGGYVVADSTITGGVTDITMTNGQKVNFAGLAEGTYYLVEISTSSGYNLLDGLVTVTITDTTTYNDDGSIKAISHEVAYEGGGVSGTGTVTVTNNAGTVLPSTGGIGTTIFYVIGAVLVIAAGVVLVTRRRMNVQ